jgi:uncharacterized damage-inducible protein DinB
MSYHICLEVALKATIRSRDDLARAANAISADRRLWRPGEYMNSAVEIVAHSAATNRLFASAFSGEPLPYLTRAEKDAAIRACDTMEKSMDFLNFSVSTVCDTLVKIQDEQLPENIIMPWGERIPLALGILSPAFHMEYHQGQLNAIQLLSGDEDYH